MLPAAHRMLRSEDFGAAVRSGARSGTRRLVIHYRVGEAGEKTPALVGVVVPKKQVSRATHRNRVKRRLRALMSERVGQFEPGSKVVVRGLAGADGAASPELARDLDRCLERLRGPAVGRSGGEHQG
ncbi:ribonuclease P protein component [Actinomyces trachealis]|uniref:ribonuclease P protein component n=1 Tax=Actinomyces trachealis TaxID=2763540 RepID=UPI001892A14A|nr:ribonuclease P protein component [Actinomyces trachealis]